MDPVFRARRAKELLQDEVLQEALSMIKQELVGVFMYPTSSQEDIMEAHRMVRAQDALRAKLQSFADEAKFAERRK